MDALTHSPTPSPQIEALILPTDIQEQMHQDLARLAPEEACGLLGGRIERSRYRAVRAWPIDNQLHSPVRYRMDPAQQLAAFDAIESLGLELVAIYHSHPLGPDHPSPTDIAEAYYPEVVSLIWSGRTGAWVCRAFTIQDKIVQEIGLIHE